VNALVVSGHARLCVSEHSLPGIHLTATKTPMQGQEPPAFHSSLLYSKEMILQEDCQG